MGRRGGGGGVGGTSQRRPSMLSPSIIHRRIDASKINHLPSDDIAEHLYSAYPDYKHFKLIPFRAKVKQILQHSRRPKHPPRNDVATEAEEESPEHRRKKQKQMVDEREEKLLKRENDYVLRRKECCFEGLSSSYSDSEASVSTSEDGIYGEDVKPEFDLMKNMLRKGYGGPKSDSKSKANEEENLEVEDVRKEKAVASLMRRGNGGGKSSSELVEERESTKGLVEVKGKEGPRFEDFGGIKTEVDRFKMEVLVPLYHPQLPQWLGVKPLSGILLHGPPGCGKTMLAHAIANETGLPFYQISATEVVSGVSGASEENIRELFSKAYRTAPSIVFIDEIDAIGSKRENLQREMERRIVTQLLTCMDECHRLVQSDDKDADFEPASKRSGHVLVIGATNRPDALDPALRRPGRFDREIALGVPDENARLEILSVVTRKLRLAGDFDMAKIARSTPGFVGADLAALADKAGASDGLPIRVDHKMGMTMDTGFLLYGPPGCGKTLIAKAVANEAGANFIHIKGPELLDKYVGESELNVRTIFTRARTCAPCILFFDEVDALTTKRGKEGGHIVERLLNQLMIELDGADKRPGVFVIGATNRPEVMDEAIKRPGRFGRMIYVPLPSPDERGLILKALAREKPIDASVDLLAFGRSASCDNMSGADLAALMHEAGETAMDEKLVTFKEEPESEVTIKSMHLERALRKVTPSVSAEFGGDVFSVFIFERMQGKV
ncbi:hypothetical protein Cgig2_005419 [Carnegiea gigantea]|uniref:AAA+ ATPase domain-containing protein n=1 Tax=Carnegiea gigantea TaxID=171969 RepID=A0A9Q1KD84_9CARY|nr:hypothetical protein Cgig2_005419 [Carnegiea gigantea]